MLTLTPMTADDYAPFLARAVEEYAKDHVRAGNWQPAEALDKSAKEFAGLLPNGVETANNWLYMLVNEAGEKVGYIWYAAHPNRPDLAFIYDFEVYEPFRRRGYGRQALAAMEQDAKARGFHNVQLHVFGHNTGARSLYQQSGYEETHVIMTKPL